MSTRRCHTPCFNFQDVLMQVSTSFMPFKLILPTQASCPRHVYVHIHTCMQPCMLACMHTYMHTYIYIQTFFHTGIHACMHACKRKCIPTDVRTHISTYVHLPFYMHIYTISPRQDLRAGCPVDGNPIASQVTTVVSGIPSLLLLVRLASGSGEGNESTTTAGYFRKPEVLLGYT